MRISEAAARSGLKVDTTRYYESEGLVPNVMRGSDGQRRFSPENVDWLTLLYWLRETGMPMKVMQRFAALYAQGDETIPIGRASCSITPGYWPNAGMILIGATKFSPESSKFLRSTCGENHSCWCLR